MNRICGAIGGRKIAGCYIREVNDEHFLKAGVIQTANEDMLAQNKMMRVHGTKWIVAAFSRLLCNSMCSCPVPCCPIGQWPSGVAAVQ
jgi:hypothetical protein